MTFTKGSFANSSLSHRQSVSSAEEALFSWEFHPLLRASPPFPPFHPFVNRVGVKGCACIKSSMLGNEKYKGDTLLTIGRGVQGGSSLIEYRGASLFCIILIGKGEAVIALHTVFDSPKDKFVFDISHQAYPHKMLTGRKDAYLYEEHYDDVSGYTNPEESEHDMFNVGHTSTSISLATGLAKARDLKGDKENIIAIIGDGSMSGGEALEGLDTAGEMDFNLIILFNDNDMSIAEVHGGMYKGFKALRDTNGKSERNLFKAMGLDYRFVADGNDTEALLAVLNEVKDIDHPVVVHIVTQKGKGYKIAEENKEDWHWHMPFDIETGEARQEMVDPYAEQRQQPSCGWPRKMRNS